MEEKTKVHLANVRAKTIYYVVFVAILFVFTGVLSLLSRLIMGPIWANQYNSYVTAVGFGIVVPLATVVATRVAYHAKK